MADEKRKPSREKDMDLSFDPDEEVTSEEEEKQIKLNLLAATLSSTRSEAIRGRQASGIETVWREDEAYYQGIDGQDMSGGNWDSKPAGQAQIPEDSDDGTGSTMFVNITATYVDASAARVGDMAIPLDDKSFSIDATPVPDLIAIADGKIPEHINKQIDESFPGDPEAAEATKQEVIAEESKILLEAKTKAGKAEKRINDWHEDGNYAAEKRKTIEDAAKCGSGVLKGPIPENQTSIAYIKGKLVKQDKMVPVSRKISYWNLFPDPAAGTNIHNGSYIWERDDITRKQLYKLRKNKRYNTDEIIKVLEEGPYRAVKDWANDEDTGFTYAGLKEERAKSMFEIWYFYGQISKEDFIAAGGVDDEDDPLPDVIDAHMVMVNNRVIKAVINHSDTGDFPYDVYPWKQREHMPWGMGIARQLRQSQDMINAATRNMMDNAGMAGGPMWIFQQGLVEPLDGNYEIAPRKGWMAAEDADMDDVRKAFTYIQMDMMVDELQKIIQLGLKFAEDVTGMPMILQGQQGSAPDTVGGMQILNSNASTVLRRIARSLDDHITEPHVRRYYKYLLQYGEDESEKGEFTINARGSSALVEREIQSQSIVQLGQYAADPKYGIDPKKFMIELLKSQRFDPTKFGYTDEEWKALVEQMAQQAQTPPDTKLQQVELKVQADAQKQQLQIQHEANEKALDRSLELQSVQINATIEDARLQVQERMGKDKHKVELAKVAATLKMQEKLSKPPEGKKQVAKEAAEPTGKAKKGEGFTK